MLGVSLRAIGLLIPHRTTEPHPSTQLRSPEPTPGCTHPVLAPLESFWSCSFLIGVLVGVRWVRSRWEWYLAWETCSYRLLRTILRWVYYSIRCIKNQNLLAFRIVKGVTGNSRAEFCVFNTPAYGIGYIKVTLSCVYCKGSSSHICINKELAFWDSLINNALSTFAH